MTTELRGKTATSIGQAGLTTFVKYHSTPVVCFDGEKIVLNSGGWLTPTTKRRMNQAAKQFELGFSVYQKAGNWAVVFDGQKMDFHDGMVLNRTEVK